MQCPKCKSENVELSRENTGTVSGSHTAVRAGHGCLYWLFVGWWIWIFKLLFLPITIFRRKKVGELNTVSTEKQKYATIAICQNCGYTWKASKK